MVLKGAAGGEEQLRAVPMELKSISPRPEAAPQLTPRQPLHRNGHSKLPRLSLLLFGLRLATAVREHALHPCEYLRAAR